MGQWSSYHTQRSHYGTQGSYRNARAVTTDVLSFTHYKKLLLKSNRQQNPSHPVPHPDTTLGIACRLCLLW